MDGQMANLAYDDHRSSFSMLLTIGHPAVPCTMGKHNALWFSNMNKPSTLINLEHSNLVIVYSNKILLIVYSNGLLMG
jgi:adenylosuccinate lyase